MASPTLVTPTSKLTPLRPVKPKSTTAAAVVEQPLRRHFLSLSATTLSLTPFLPISPALAASDEEYIKETEEVINKIRSTISLEKTDPNVPTAVADLRDASNSWVAKYRKEKNLLGRPSFRDIYSALNAVSGHYISFGPTAPLPAKRKVRILEEMDTAEKALLRGR